MRVAPVLVAGLVTLAGWSGSAHAGTITCPSAGSYDRQITMTNVTQCTFQGEVTGTPDADDVAGEFPPGPWTNKGQLTSNGTNGWLTVTLTSGSWGDSNVSGTWSLNPAFWAAYGAAVISFHLGNGAGNPDWFFFQLVDQATSGTFNIVRLSGGGGGLSNMNLWGTREPNLVPEPATLLLLGSGLAVFAARARRQKARLL